MRAVACTGKTSPYMPVAVMNEPPAILSAAGETIHGTVHSKELCTLTESIAYADTRTVREMGLEPTRQRHRNLNPARLPIPPLAHAYQPAGRYAKP